MIKAWPDILWAFVDEDFHLENLFFLALDQQSVFLRSQKQGLGWKSSEECLASLRDYCNQLVIAMGPKVTIRPTAFKEGDHGYSPAICMIALQILAVEKMISDEKGGANKYYLRLREISGYSTDDHSNPFEFEDFEKLWKQFAKELRTLKKAQPHNITFRRGEQGQNKYRNYPMSQSLLDEQSLRVIHYAIKRIDKKTDNSLVRLASVLPNITNRSRRNLKKRVLRSAIANQIRAFEPLNADALKGRSPKIDSPSGAEVAKIECFFLYRDDEDFGDDVWCLKYHDPRSPTLSAIDAFNYFVEKEEFKGVFFYVEGYRHKPISLISAIKESREASYLLMRRKDYSELAETLGGLSSKLISEEVARVPDGLMLLQCGSGIVDALGAPKTRFESPLSFSGGISVNAVSNIYLAGYPPEHISFNGDALNPEIQINVDGQETTVKDFLAACLAIHEDFFDVTYQGHKKGLRILTNRDVVEDPPFVGFWIENGKLPFFSKQDSVKRLGLSHSVFLSARKRDVGYVIRDWVENGRFDTEVLIDFKFWLPASHALIDGALAEARLISRTKPQLAARLREGALRKQKVPPGLYKAFLDTDNDRRLL